MDQILTPFPDCRRVIDNLTVDPTNKAYDLATGPFPDTNQGPSEENKWDEKNIESLYTQCAAHFSDSLPEYSFSDPPNWATDAIRGWQLPDGRIICIFLTRDDWDTPLTLTVGTIAEDKLKSHHDPWSWERKTA